MRIGGDVILGMLIVLVSVTAAPACAGRVSGAGGLEGAWEGFIAETPARLTRIGVDLKRASGSWEGTIDLPGVEGLPLSAIRAEGADLHFELQVGETLVVFDAEYAAETISGRVVEGGRSLTFDLQKLPDYPHRPTAWRRGSRTSTWCAAAS